MSKYGWHMPIDGGKMAAEWSHRQGSAQRRPAEDPWSENAHPLVAAHSEALAGYWLAIADALDQAVAHDGVLMLACDAEWR